MHDISSNVRFSGVSYLDLKAWHPIYLQFHKSLVWLACFGPAKTQENRTLLEISCSSRPFPPQLLYSLLIFAFRAAGGGGASKPCISSDPTGARIGVDGPARRRRRAGKGAGRE